MKIYFQILMPNPIKMFPTQYCPVDKNYLSYIFFPAFPYDYRERQAGFLLLLRGLLIQPLHGSVSLPEPQRKIRVPLCHPVIADCLSNRLPAPD